MLALHELTKRYGEKHVLRGISLAVPAGQCICVAGGNAQGKTTLLRIAAGRLRPDAGRVERTGAVGYVPQSCELMEDLSVRDNLRLWYAAAKRSARQLFAPDSPEYALGLREHAAKRVSRLSGGYQKRVSIAAALIGRPASLLLDEPFASLDTRTRDDVLALLRRFADDGGAVLFSSHEPWVVARIADEIHVLEDGALRERLCLARGADAQERLNMVTELFCRMP